MKILLLLITVALFPITGHSQTATRHDERTAQLGNVFFFMVPGYPYDQKTMFFMQQIHGINNLTAGVYQRRWTAEENQHLLETKQLPFMDAFGQVVQQMYEGREEPPLPFDQLPPAQKGVVVSDEIATKYNAITREPSFLYFAPRGRLYRFDFSVRGRDAAIQRFWQIFADETKYAPKIHWNFGAEATETPLSDADKRLFTIGD